MNEPSTHSELPPSSADKWFNCHAWRRLNHGIEDTTSAAAEEGTVAHAWLSDHLLGLRDLTDCDDPEMYDHLMMVADWIVTTAGEEGTTHAEDRVDFGSSFGFEGLTGTSDLVIDFPDKLIVADLKYGRGVVEVSDNKQLLCYLVGAVAKFGRRPIYKIAILQPRAWHRDGPTRSTTLTDEELQSFEAGLVLAIQGSYSNKAVATAGPWCQHYCKALSRCPAAAAKALDLFRSTPA